MIFEEGDGSPDGGVALIFREAFHGPLPFRIFTRFSDPFRRSGESRRLFPSAARASGVGTYGPVILMPPLSFWIPAYTCGNDRVPAGNDGGLAGHDSDYHKRKHAHKFNSGFPLKTAGMTEGDLRA